MFESGLQNNNYDSDFSDDYYEETDQVDDDYYSNIDDDFQSNLNQFGGSGSGTLYMVIYPCDKMSVIRNSIYENLSDFHKKMANYHSIVGTIGKYNPHNDTYTFSPVDHDMNRMLDGRLNTDITVNIKRYRLWDRGTTNNDGVIYNIATNNRPYTKWRSYHGQVTSSTPPTSQVIQVEGQFTQSWPFRSKTQITIPYTDNWFWRKGTNPPDLRVSDTPTPELAPTPTSEPEPATQTTPEPEPAPNPEPDLNYEDSDIYSLPEDFLELPSNFIINYEDIILSDDIVGENPSKYMTVAYIKDEDDVCNIFIKREETADPIIFRSDLHTHDFTSDTKATLDQNFDVSKSYQLNIQFHTVSFQGDEQPVTPQYKQLNVVFLNNLYLSMFNPTVSLDSSVIEETDTPRANNTVFIPKIKTLSLDNTQLTIDLNNDPKCHKSRTFSIQYSTEITKWLPFWMFMSKLYGIINKLVSEATTKGIANNLPTSIKLTKPIQYTHVVNKTELTKSTDPFEYHKSNSTYRTVSGGIESSMTSVHDLLLNKCNTVEVKFIDNKMVTIYQISSTNLISVQQSMPKQNADDPTLKPMTDPEKQLYLS